ncbi:MAG: HEAT repeat domain-containing protein [Myxococcota bacterium]
MMPEHGPSIPDALAVLKHPDQQQRLAMLQDILEGWPISTALQLVEQGLQSPHIRPRATSARLVGLLWVRYRSDDLRLCAPLLAMLVCDAHQPGRVRKSAAWSLGWIGSHDAVEALTTLGDHTNPMYRRTAMEASGRIGGLRAATFLVGGLHDPAWQVRMDAAIGLGGLCDSAITPSVGEAFERALQAENHPRTLEQMLRSLPELVSTGALTPERAAALLGDRLGPAYPTPVRCASARGLGELGSTYPGAALARELLQSASVRPPASIREQARWALAHLASHRHEATALSPHTNHCPPPTSGSTWTNEAPSDG